MNYCIYIKRRKGKPFCTYFNKEVTWNECKECKKKVYKMKNKKNSFYTKSESNSKNAQYLKKTVQKKKIHHTKKRITVSKEVYNAVIQRDNYSCRLCGSTNWLQLHHIIYRSERKDLINDIDNCIMLCENCHCTVHSNKKKWQPILIEMNKKKC